MKLALEAITTNTLDKAKLEEAGLALKKKIEDLKVLGQLHNSVNVIKFATEDLTIRRVKLNDCHVHDSIDHRKKELNKYYMQVESIN